MDDFRIGSIPSPDPYGRQPSGSSQRKRQKQRDGEEGQEQDAATDTFEAVSAADDGLDDTDDESIEDYYLPADPGEVE
jgi:hypothetical protein